MLKVFVDGSCKITPKNPVGPTSWAWLITDDQGTISHGTEAGPAGTLVEAEYFALIAGLKALRALGHTGPAQVCGDNAIVINQVRGAYRCNADNLQHLHRQAQRLVAELTAAGCQVELVTIPRGENLADTLLRDPLKYQRRPETRGPGRITKAELDELLRPAARVD